MKGMVIASAMAGLFALAGPAFSQAQQVAPAPPPAAQTTLDQPGAMGMCPCCQQMAAMGQQGGRMGMMPMMNQPGMPMGQMPTTPAPAQPQQ